jgi:hypothetical protein
VTKLVRIFVLAFAFASLGSMPAAIAGDGNGVPASTQNGSQACAHANSDNSEVRTSEDCPPPCFSDSDHQC